MLVVNRKDKSMLALIYFSVTNTPRASSQDTLTYGLFQCNIPMVPVVDPIVSIHTNVFHELSSGLSHTPAILCVYNPSYPTVTPHPLPSLPHGGDHGRLHILRLIYLFDWRHSGTLTAFPSPNTFNVPDDTAAISINHNYYPWWTISNVLQTTWYNWRWALRPHALESRGLRVDTPWGRG